MSDNDHFVSSMATVTMGWPNLSLTCSLVWIGRNLFFMIPGLSRLSLCTLGGLMVARPSPLSCQEKTLLLFLSPSFSRLPTLPAFSG